MKKEMRKQILEKRNSLTKEEIKEKSKIIKKKLFSSEEYQQAKTVSFFVSFGSEVDTHDMIKEALKEKEVCVPIVQGDYIILSKINDFDDLDKKGKYGILEPSSIIEVDKELVDLIIVPGVAFDKKGHRIGYGKGYYDSLLIDYKGNTIGLCFSLQLISKVPVKEHDVRVKKVITEKEIIPIHQ